MCRFSSKDDEGYRQILGEIQILILGIQKGREQVALERDKELSDLKTRSPSQVTTASTAPCM